MHGPGPQPEGPAVHGIHDFWLGGSQHLRADRDLARAVEERFPAMPASIRAARDFCLRAARWSAQERGISRFIRADAVARPHGPHVHGEVRAVNPSARVVYVSRTPGAHAWTQALLGGDGIEAAEAGGPAEVAQAPAVAGLLSGGEPACLVLGLTGHTVPPRDAAGLTAGWVRLMPPGSVIVAALLADGDPGDIAALSAVFPVPVYRHSLAEVRARLVEAGLRSPFPPGAPWVGDARAMLSSRWAAGRDVPPPGRPAGIIALRP
jgi:hypothetical protein